MENKSHNLKFGTTAAASSIRAAVAPASSACADTPGQSASLGALGASGDTLSEDAEGCNCSVGESCEFCDFICPDCGSQMDRDNFCAACHGEGDLDAAWESVYGRYAADCRQREGDGE